MPASKFTVGQQVWVYDVNSRRRGGPTVGEIVKVGRKLFTVAYGFREEQFRLDTGRANDGAGNQYIKTEQDRLDDDRRMELVSELRAAGLEVRPRPPLPLAALEAVAGVLRERAVPDHPRESNPRQPDTRRPVGRGEGRTSDAPGY